MKTCVPFSCFFLIITALTVANPDARSETSRESLLKDAESRLQAIYDRDEFRAARFRADWLSDGSGYTVLTDLGHKSM